jgi:hypothetical protein
MFHVKPSGTSVRTRVWALRHVALRPQLYDGWRLPLGLRSEDRTPHRRSRIMTAFHGSHVSRETYGDGVLQSRNQSGPLGPCVQLVCPALSGSMGVGARQCGMKRQSGRTRNCQFSKGVTGFAPRGFDPRPSNLCGIVSKELLSRRPAFLWVRWRRRAVEKCAK